MEDLFGHNRKPIMPKTAEIEEFVYRTVDEENSYRGIKDTTFGIESEAGIIATTGFLTSRSSAMGTMRDFVPNPEGYIMGQLHHTLNDTNPINTAEIQRLTLLNDGQYKTLVSKLPENAQDVTINTLKAYEKMLNCIRTLSDIVLPEAIEIYRRICAEGYEWDNQRQDFKEAELKLISVIDSIDVQRAEIDGTFYGSMEPADSSITQEEFNNYMPTFISDALPHALNLRKDISAIMGQINILVGECLRINEAWHEMDKMTRPDYTLLKRYAGSIEKVPGVLETMVTTQRNVFNFFKCLTNRLEK